MCGNLHADLSTLPTRMVEIPMTIRTPLLPHRPARTPGPLERRIGALLLVLLALLAGVYAWAGTGQGPSSLRPIEAPAPPPSALPLTSPAGWPRGAVERYEPDALFEKINGKADAYIALDVEDLQFAGYSDPKDPSVFADVYIFDMGAALNAYGIYRAQRSGKETAFEVPEEGSRAGSAVFFRKGSHYVEVVGSGPQAAVETRALATAVAAALPAAAEPVRDPPWFPTDGLTIVRYARTGGLGIDALTDAFLALYDDGLQVAVARTASPKAAAAARDEAVENFEFLRTPAAFEVQGRYVLGAVGGSADRHRAMLTEVRRLVEESP